MELTPGASLGPYKILEEIGSGHMGKVYLAHDERLDRRVAIKMLTGSTGTEAERRLKKEARAIARLNNPNIAALYDLAEYDGVSLLVMEYADGESLSDLVIADIGVDRTIDIGLQLTNALAYAHREGIIHRDVKPANVKLTRGGTVKLLDLGIARVSASDPGATTRDIADTAVAAGTPAYMAPERLRGHPADVRTDVYSVGVLLFELLTGGRPYPQRDMFSLHAAMGRAQTPRARAVNPKVPRTLDDVVAKAMAHDPRMRYSSAAELHDDLLRARDASSRRVVPIVTPRSGLGWTVLAALAIIAAAIVWALMRPTIPPAPPTLAVLPAVNDNTDQPELDELGSLMQSVIARNFAAAPGIRIVSRSPAQPTDAPPGYTAQVRLRHATAGFAGDVTLSRLGKVVKSLPIEGDALKVLRSALDSLATEFEQSYSPGRAFSDAERAALRRSPTEIAEALSSYLKGRTILDTSDDSATDDRAIAAFQDAVGRDKTFAVGQAGLSQAYASYDKHADKKVPNRAIDVARLARDLDANCDQARLAVALALPTSDRSAAIDEARTALMLTPDNDNANRILGQLLVDRSQPDAGFAELRTATLLRPTHWINWYQLGRSLLYVYKYQDSIEPLDKMRVNVPNFESAFVNLGFAQTALGHTEVAVSYLEHALQLSPNDHYALNNLATAYFWDKQYDKSEIAYNKAIGWDKSNPKLFMNLGDVNEALNRQGPARTAYGKCIELADARLPVRDPETEAIAAKCQAKIGDVATAETRALATLPDKGNPEILYKLAVVYALGHKSDRALERLEQAVQRGYSPFFVREDPDLRTLRADQRFQKLIAR